MVIEEEGNDKFETEESDAAAAAAHGDHAWSMRRQHLVMGI